MQPAELEHSGEVKQIFHEPLISAHGLASVLKCSPSKVYKLIRSGAKAIDGRTVRLGIVITECGKKTSLEAYRRFQVELNKAACEYEQQQRETRVD